MRYYLCIFKKILPMSYIVRLGNVGLRVDGLAMAENENISPFIDVEEAFR